MLAARGMRYPESAPLQSTCDEPAQPGLAAHEHQRDGLPSFRCIHGRPTGSTAVLEPAEGKPSARFARTQIRLIADGSWRDKSRG
jgi:hypothetical protein